MTNANRKIMLNAVDVVNVTHPPMGAAIQLNVREKYKVLEFLITYHIADAAKAIRTDIIIDQNTPSQMTPTNQRRVETEDKYNQRNNRPTVSTNKEDTFLAPVIKYIKSTKEASTQTDSVAETQTESQQGIGLGRPSEQFWIELLTGTMQIWETVKNREERTLAVKSLVDHVVYSTEKIKPKDKTGKHRTSSQSPVNTRKKYIWKKI